MARHGLILWENAATGSKKLFKHLPALLDPIFHPQIKKHIENQKHRNIMENRIFIPYFPGSATWLEHPHAMEPPIHPPFLFDLSTDIYLKHRLLSRSEPPLQYPTPPILSKLSTRFPVDNMVHAWIPSPGPCSSELCQEMCR